MILTVPRPYRLRKVGIPDQALIAAAIFASGFVGFVATNNPAGALAATSLALAVCAAVRTALPRLSAAGVIEMAVAPLSLLIVTPWTWLMLGEQGFPAWARTLVLAGAGLGALVLAFTFATRLADEAIHTHARWRRPTRALPARGGASAPKVSIHVPCYAEPPEVVIETLERLARLDYVNFEVLVCDNNTADEALWRPLQRWCRNQTLRRPEIPFRFFHVAPLAGAKAGALNFLLGHTARDAEIISVIDADYLAEPDFLARLTGFFADERIGFVQTPHDYRPDASAYQQMCYWEYMPSNKLGLASINEYDCAYTIGTMCLFRKDAIEAAGGWAEWCLTEDSEISIRIRALGYEGMFVNETFGRGLIPETYEDYKKQRFRWTAGPVQQLLIHWRLFLPRILGGRSKLHGWAKLMEVHRSIAPLAGIAGAVLGVAAAVGGAWATVTGRLPTLQLPHVFWVALSLGAVTSLARLWQRYRLTGCSSPTAILGAEIARVSLDYVKTMAAIAPLSGRPIKWRRTPKFAASGSALRALVSTRTEMLCASILGLAAFLPHYYRDGLGAHLAPMATVACGLGCVAFLCAPVMAVFSEVRLHRVAKAEQPTAPAAEPAALHEPAAEPLSQVA